MKKILVVIVLALLALSSAAQPIYSQRRALVPFDGRVKLSGWYIGPGLSYTFTRPFNTEEDIFKGNDTLYRATTDPSGRVGLYFEAGRYHIFRYGVLFNYIDYGLAFKQIRGRESYTGRVMAESNSALLLRTEGEGTYSHSFVTAHLNFNNIIQLGDYSFLQSTLGLNLDYRVISGQSYSHNSALGALHTPYNPSAFMAQLHFKLGFGYKLSDHLFVIPALETPILSFYEWENGRSSYPMFGSRYRPVFLSLRFAWLRKPKNDCPPVYGNPDDKRKQQQYLQER